MGLSRPELPQIHIAATCAVGPGWRRQFAVCRSYLLQVPLTIWHKNSTITQRSEEALGCPLAPRTARLPVCHQYSHNEVDSLGIIATHWKGFLVGYWKSVV